MESTTPSSSRYIAQSSKKRVFPGERSSSGYKDVEILETRTSSKIISKTKQKEVVCEIIDVDIEGDCGDVMIIDKKVDRKGKGKEISSNVTVELTNLSNDGSGSDIKTSKNVNVDDPSSNLFFGEDEWIDTYYDDIIFDDSTVLESQFDHIDIPPGVEVPFPWLQNNTSSTSASSSLQIKSNGANLDLESSSSHASLNLKSTETKDQKTLPLSKKGSRADRQLVKEALKEKEGSMLLKTGRGLRKWTTLSSQIGAGPFLFSSGNSNKKTRASKVYSGPQYQFPNGVNKLNSSLLNKDPGVGIGIPMLHYTPLNITGPSGFVNGSAFGPWAQDSANNQNGEPPGMGEKNLDEILQGFDLFKKFDTVEDCSDHFYANKGSSSKRPAKNWAKKIQEEWKILEKDLPDTIFVRVYESRMDLLRAVIIGADGTPYHDGLFFFDVFFPDNYPNVPPLVHYHSGGLRINPNLYNCGKVCLSLLNTWGGGVKEMWTPGVSTMLQVLVSIQGLILNTKPYFNEPAWASLSGSKKGEQCSLDYNEKTFIYNLQTMVYTMRRPPKHFEAFVAGYFCKHARDILVSCKAYMEGVQVGCLVRGGVQDVDEDGKSCSDNFKVSLGGFITTLIDTFSRIGAKDCQEFSFLAQMKVKGPGLLLGRRY